MVSELHWFRCFVVVFVSVCLAGQVTAHSADRNAVSIGCRELPRTNRFMLPIATCRASGNLARRQVVNLLQGFEEISDAA